MIEYPKPNLEGYSVAMVDRPLYNRCYRVYRNDIYVAQISPLFNGKLAFDWHDRYMWRYSVDDFIVAQRSV